MSQRGYLIFDKETKDEPTFSLVMAWDALEPYVLNDEFGIDGFACSGPPMVIDVKQIRDDLEQKTEHAMAHEKLLAQICDETTRDIVLYEIV